MCNKKKYYKKIPEAQAEMKLIIRATTLTVN